MIKLSFIHRFEPPTMPGRAPLLLLHGTGGNEHDLIAFGRLVAPGAALLAPRGQVLENGMPRFFRRLAEGVFDQEDLRRRTADLAAFIAEARAAYDLPAPIALGFSNGANIAASLLLRHPQILAGAVLLRAMVPFDEPPTTPLPGTPVLLLSGSHDPIVPAANAARLASLLDMAGARVEHRAMVAGHALTHADASLTGEWLNRRTLSPPMD
jgi:phospholipase/carboxylesterase